MSIELSTSKIYGYRLPVSLWLQNTIKASEFCSVHFRTDLLRRIGQAKQSQFSFNSVNSESRVASLDGEGEMTEIGLRHSVNIDD